MGMAVAQNADRVEVRVDGWKNEVAEVSAKHVRVCDDAQSVDSERALKEGVRGCVEASDWSTRRCGGKHFVLAAPLEVGAIV